MSKDYPDFIVSAIKELPTCRFCGKPMYFLYEFPIKQSTFAADICYLQTANFYKCENNHRAYRANPGVEFEKID